MTNTIWWKWVGGGADERKTRPGGWDEDHSYLRDVLKFSMFLHVAHRGWATLDMLQYICHSDRKISCYNRLEEILAKMVSLGWAKRCVGEPSEFREHLPGGYCMPYHSVLGFQEPTKLQIEEAWREYDAKQK